MSSRGSVRSIFASALTIRLRQFAISLGLNAFAKSHAIIFVPRFFFHWWCSTRYASSRWLLCSLCLLIGPFAWPLNTGLCTPAWNHFGQTCDHLCTSVWQGSDDQKILMHSKRFIKHPLTGTKLGWAMWRTKLDDKASYFSYFSKKK